MQAPFDNIVQHLFHQPSLHSITVDELENMAQQHPYFAAAHFLLLKKMQDTDHPQFNTQLHKTTLYFNNPLWLQFLLQPETITNFTVSEKSPFITNETGATRAATEESEPENIPVPVEEVYQPIDQVPVSLASDQNKEISVEPSVQYLSGSTFSAAHNRIINVIKEVFNEAGSLLQPDPVIEEINTIVPEEIIAQPSAEFIYDDPAMPMGEPIVKNIPGENIVPVVPEKRKEVETAINKEEKPLFKTIIETSAAKNDLLFEPYHTVDYFASQGIKLSKIEADSKDKLGRQLKSFTEWLKSMKKLPQVSIEKILSENEESKVVEDAIHSIENKEVITEAMAEVFEKQGMTEEAAEVYQKLSLLNPGKSAYFAAKIEVLKQ